MSCNTHYYRPSAPHRSAVFVTGFHFRYVRVSETTTYGGNDTKTEWRNVPSGSHVRQLDEMNFREHTVAGNRCAPVFFAAKYEWARSGMCAVRLYVLCVYFAIFLCPRGLTPHRTVSRARCWNREQICHVVVVVCSEQKFPLEIPTRDWNIRIIYR